MEISYSIHSWWKSHMQIQTKHKSFVIVVGVDWGQIQWSWWRKKIINLGGQFILKYLTNNTIIKFQNPTNITIVPYAHTNTITNSSMVTTFHLYPILDKFWLSLILGTNSKVWLCLVPITLTYMEFSLTLKFQPTFVKNEVFIFRDEPTMSVSCLHGVTIKWE